MILCDLVLTFSRLPLMSFLCFIPAVIFVDSREVLRFSCVEIEAYYNLDEESHKAVNFMRFVSWNYSRSLWCNMLLYRFSQMLSYLYNSS